MHKITNEWGFSLVELIKITEKELKDNELYMPITDTLIVVNFNEKYLIGFNKDRDQWEIPGGGIEEGETPVEGVIRELFEETNQVIDDAQFIGLAKIYDSNREVTEYLALYYKNIDKLSPFYENEEMREIKLWNMKDEIGKFDDIERAVMEFCIENREVCD